MEWRRLAFVQLPACQSTLAAPRAARCAMLAADRRLPGRHLADLGLDLPGDQVGAGQLAAVLPDGHALRRRRRCCWAPSRAGAARAWPTRERVVQRRRCWAR
ncbi:MAG: hypothetical protein MZW92_16075 [Comamonadaceae bacterium]|nr:hypothetical protein [Comamonadaceae bacterium]